MTWNIYRLDYPGSRVQTLLGTVEAPHHPAAMLAAIAKFNVTDDTEQRKLRAEVAR